MAHEVPAVLTAVRLLERIARDWPEPVAAGVLIHELELNRSTCYNVLGTLQRAGWTTSRGDRSGRSLGPRLLAMAKVSDDWMTETVQQDLGALSSRLGFIAFAIQRHGGGGYLVTAKAERGRGVRITLDVGDVLPFSTPAIMRAFHAWSDLDDDLPPARAPHRHRTRPPPCRDARPAAPAPPCTPSHSPPPGWHSARLSGPGTCLGHRARPRLTRQTPQKTRAEGVSTRAPRAAEHVPAGLPRPGQLMCPPTAEPRCIGAAP